MIVTALWEIGKFFFILTAGLYALLALILLVYLPFCIVDCLRQRRAADRWAPHTASTRSAAPAVDSASTLQPTI